MYIKPCQISKMESFAEIVNSLDLRWFLNMSLDNVYEVGQRIHQSCSSICKPSPFEVRLHAKKLEKT